MACFSFGYKCFSVFVFVLLACLSFLYSPQLSLDYVFVHFPSRVSPNLAS